MQNECDDPGYSERDYEIRAKNRAISDMVAAGEVSAEEVSV